MMQKTKRVYVWCSKTPRCVDFHVGIRKRNKIKCRIGTVTIAPAIRCPDCGKKFKPRIRGCDDRDCWHVYIPAHKKWVKSKPPNTAV